MKTIGIFCGGFSSEYEISLKSADTIKKHIPDTYLSYKIIVSKGKWEVEMEQENVPFDLNDCSFFIGDTKK